MDENEDTICSIRAWRVLGDGVRGEAELGDLQRQVGCTSDVIHEDWLEMYESSEILEKVRQAEQAFVELGGVPGYE